jgi:hypothetical protein
MEDNGLEHLSNLQGKSHLRNEAAHNPAQLAGKWSVLLVDSSGQIQSEIADDLSYLKAIAFAAGWQSRSSGLVAVVIPATPR